MNLTIRENGFLIFVSIRFLIIGYHPKKAMKIRELSILGDTRSARSETATYIITAGFAPNSSLKIRTQIDARAGPTYSANGNTPPKNMNVIERAERIPPKAVRKELCLIYSSCFCDENKRLSFVESDFPKFYN